MGVAARKSDVAPGARLAESLRRANACREMALVLKALGRQSSVPDIKWMADVAAEELSAAASSAPHAAR